MNSGATAPEWVASSAAFTFDTAVNTTFGSTVTLTTSIPATATEVIIHFRGVSLSGADDILVQLGDSGGIETTGYEASGMVDGGTANAANGFPIYVSNASRAVSGRFPGRASCRRTGWSVCPR